MNKKHIIFFVILLTSLSLFSNAQLPSGFGFTLERPAYRAKSQPHFSQEKYDEVFEAPYHYPTLDKDELALCSRYIEAGCKYVRHPFHFRNLVYKDNPDWKLNKEKVSKLKESVEWFTNQKIFVILGPHSYWIMPKSSWMGGMSENEEKRFVGGSTTIYTWDDPDADISVKQFCKLWSDLVTYLGDNPYVIYEPGNEPHDHNLDVLFRIQQEYVKALRDAGHTGYVAVTLNEWAHFTNLFEPDATGASAYEYLTAKVEMAGGGYFDPDYKIPGKCLIAAHFYATQNLGGGGEYDPSKYDKFISSLEEVKEKLIPEGFGVLLDEFALFNPDYAAEEAGVTKQEVLEKNKIILDAVKNGDLVTCNPWRMTTSGGTLRYRFTPKEYDIPSLDDLPLDKWPENARQYFKYLENEQ